MPLGALRQCRLSARDRLQPGRSVPSRGIQANAAEVTLRSLEVELSVVPVEGLTLAGTYGYLDSEYDEFLFDLDQDGTVDDNSDRPISAAPKYSFSATATYVQPLGPGDLFFYYEYTYSDELQSPTGEDPRSTLITPDRQNVALGYTWDMNETSYRVSAFIRDIQKQQIVDGYRTCNPPLFCFNMASRGREWGVELGFEF